MFNRHFPHSPAIPTPPANNGDQLSQSHPPTSHPPLLHRRQHVLQRRRVESKELLQIRGDRWWDDDRVQVLWHTPVRLPEAATAGKAGAFCTALGL